MLSFGIIGKRAPLFCGLMAVSLSLAGCGGSSSSSTSTTTSTVAKVTLAPAAASVGLNQTQAFGATATDSNGTILVGQPYTWTSSAPNVALINDVGVATGLAVGTTQITASTPSSNTTNAAVVISNAVTLTVTANVASVTISPTSATIPVGGTQQFTATAKDASGNTLSGVVFSWSSSFAGVATIDNTGLAKGVAASQNPVTIQASANGVFSNMATLTVTP